MTTRRQFLQRAAIATGAAIVGAPAIVKSARAADAVSVVLPLGFSIDFFDAMYAYTAGHYAKNGIDAKIIGAVSGVQMTQLMVSGQAQFGRGAPPDQIRAVAAKLPAPISIATICQGCNFRVFSPKGKPILKAEDFKGKTVGLITAASPTGIYLDVMLSAAGLKDSDVVRQVTGGTPGAIEILKSGRVDAFISTLAVEVTLKRAGEAVEVWSPFRYLPLPGQCYLAMPETAAKNPDLGVRFLKSIKAALDDIMVGPIKPLLQRTAKDFDIPGGGDLDGHVAVLEATIKEMWLSEGKQNLLLNLPQLWEKGVAALNAAKIVDLHDPTVLYTNALVEKALHG